MTMLLRRVMEELLGRSAFYHGLSVILRGPDAQTQGWLAMREHHRLPEIVRLLTKGEAGPLHEAVRRLVKELDSTPAPEWLQAYERIFGHSVHGAAPPYELEYGEEHEHRQPQALSDIAAFYQAFGLRMASASHERMDHIVTECEFMQILLYKQACALDGGIGEGIQICEAAARRFLKDHLGRWGPAFASRLSRAASHGILRSAAEATLAWLSEDCARMAVRAGTRDLPLKPPNEREEAGCAACVLQQPEVPNGA